MKSVFIKSYIALVVLMFLTLIATLIITDNLLEDVDIDNFTTEAAVEYQLLQSLLKQKNIPIDSVNIDQYKPTFEFDIGIKHIDNVPVNSDDDPFQNADPGIFVELEDGLWGYAIPYMDNRRVILLTETEISLSEVPTEDWLEFFIPVCALFLVMGLGILYLARSLIKPLQHLDDVATKLGNGDFDARTVAKKSKPITTLASNFNHMADYVKELIKEQQIIIGAIPHELRTPLAKARFALDMTRNKESLQDIRTQIEYIDDAVDELDRVVDSTLQVNRLHNSGTTTKHRCNLNDIITNCILETEINDSKSIKFDSTQLIKSNINSNADLLSVLIRNILSNAVRHAHCTVAIYVTEPTTDIINIIIEDDGEGNSKGNTGRIFFIPFNRLDESRNRDSGGVGLGLAIVKLIATKLNLSIKVEQSTLGGALFFNTWYKYKNRLD